MLWQESQQRRWKAVCIDPDMVLGLLKVPETGMKIGDCVVFSVGDHLPDSAKVVRIGIEDRGNLVLIVEDESFSPLGVEERAPLLRLKFETKELPPLVQDENP